MAPATSPPVPSWLAACAPAQPVHILVVDDEVILATTIARLLGQRGYAVTRATSGEEAVALAAGHPFDLLLTDVYLPDQSGLDVAEAVRAHQRDVVVVVMTGEGTVDLAIKAIRHGAEGFIIKPFTIANLIQRMEEALERHRLAQENLRLRVLAPMLEETVAVLAAAIEARDQETGSHAGRLAELADALAHSIGLDETDRAIVRRGALLHDIGKIGVPDHILRKGGALTREEWREMRRHPTIGAGMVERINGLQPVAPLVRHHHERWDGAGYPDGLAGEAIPLGARILTIVDAYDAMISDRPYRRGMAACRAREQLIAGRGSQFDPGLVDAFLAVPTGADCRGTTASNGGHGTDGLGSDGLFWR